jgi:polyhydroxyalkanoate synthesis repressor PhaR
MGSILPNEFMDSACLDEEPAPPKSTDSIMVYRHSSRRLYAPTQSRHVTFSDIRKWVLERTEFQVIEKATGWDITREILMRVLLELESPDPSTFSREFLLELIRRRRELTAAGLAGHLEREVGVFLGAEGAVRRVAEFRHKSYRCK